MLPIILALLALAPAVVSEGPRQMAITVDDLPGVTTHPTLVGLTRMNRQVLAALRAARAPAIGFVNESKLLVDGERDGRVEILRTWLNAGMTLGNHTYRHRGLTKTTLRDYEDDVLRGEAVTRPLLEARDQQLIYFRHPYTQTGPTVEVKDAVQRFLAERGYKVAPFTIENSDWMFASLYEDALERGDRKDAAAIRDAYLAHSENVCAFFEGLARRMFRRDIAQILLIHVNRLNADALPQLLDRLQQRRYQFVTLDEALADQAYRTPDLYVGANGPSWLHRWTVARKEPFTLREEPDVPADIFARAEALRKKASQPAVPPK